MTPIRKLDDSRSNGASVNEVRSKYLAFFAARGHAIIPSAPIVPDNDPTTLFTSSGMQPLVPYLLGQEHPSGARLADSQLSFRAEDIEEVGNNRHTTFFEMLGNWSLGDYFKQEQLPWLYEFLINKEEGLGLDPKNLYITTFSGDEESGMGADTESVEIWKKIGIADDHLSSYGAKKNWWSRSGAPSKMPAGEIGGPDSEVFYDFGTPHNSAFGEKCHTNCDCGRFVEIGNSVFMQFIKQADESFKELPKRNVDFGGGLERLSSAVIKNSDIFMIDIFDTARAVLEKRSDKKYGASESVRSFRIILDHMRASSFFIASGIRPSNTEQGYVLRRLIRRSIREADKLGIKDAVLAEVADGFGDAYADAYPFVQSAANIIREELEKEEVQFRKTLANGMRELEKMGDTIDAFMLFTTYGFPIELTAEIAKERGKEIDLNAVGKQMEEHQALSRAGAAQKFAGGLADHAEQTVRYHTAHHLLLKALQIVLGNDVHQRGSNITSERLRIDFSYSQKMTSEQKEEVEKMVNEQIQKSLPVEHKIMSREEADKLGAEHEFGAKYPDMVSVYSIGSSIEFCGGPHVANTNELGHFKILKEEASSAGVRRIKAVLE
ncbi:MAG: alanine--tRNA ligase [bacterium]|nr:alanine--tRNA ligase [bacterium]